MNQIFFLILSIIILIFGIYIITDLNQKHIINQDFLDAKTSVNTLTRNIEEYCHDPFSATSFKVINKKNFILYTNQTKVCTSDLKNQVFCSKLNCDVVDKVIFNISVFERESVCNVSKNIINSKLEVNCN